MKVRYPLIGLVLAVFLVFASANLVFAQWSAISSGFAVTTDTHKNEVMIGMDVWATAGWVPAFESGPSHTPILTVTFKWHYPADYLPDPEGVAHEETVPIQGPYVVGTDPLPSNIPQEIIDWAADNAGVVWYYAQNKWVPNVLGDWGVQAIFIDTIWRAHAWHQFKVTKSTSFEVVPEVPFGTIAIMLGWCGILGVFALRRKHLLR